MQIFDELKKGEAEEIQVKSGFTPDEDGEEYKIEFYNINNLKNINTVEEKITYGG